MRLRWIVVIISFASGCTPGDAAVQEMSLEERMEERVDGSQLPGESLPPSGCSPAVGAHAADRLALIEHADERLRDPGCVDAAAVGGSLAAQCQAIWLASMLDPIVLWVDEMAVEDRRRAAQVVDRAFALVATDPDRSVPRATDALSDLRVVNAAIASLLNASHESSGELDDARLASLLIARGEDDIVEPLRALERACHQTG